LAVSRMQQRAAGGVRAIYYSPPGIVGAQIEAVLEDFAVAAIKIGMLGSAEIANLVAVRRSWLPKTWTALAAR
jgi:hydroxymethylpyrimidine/phosphomethylpyrimidine kinase